MIELAAYSWYLFSIFIFMILSAYFSGTETAIVSANRIIIENLSSEKRRRANAALYILERKEDAIGMLLIGNNIVNISAAAFITYIGSKAFSLNDSHLFIITIIQTIVFLIFCEAAPKLFSRAKPELILITTAFPTKFLMFILNPFVKFSVNLSYKIKNLLGMKDGSKSFIMSREEISLLFSMGTQQGVIDRDNNVYVSEMLSFKELSAIELMTPAIDLITIDSEKSIKDLSYLINETGFSRIPVYKGNAENITGFTYYRDLINNKNKTKISEILRPPVFIPATKNVLDLYLEMDKQQLSLVFVVNEYGAVVGMITYEDIVEEIVGEIQTRDHSEHELITELGDNRYMLDGNLAVDYFSRLFSVKIEKNGFETIAGFMEYRTGNIPQIGEKTNYKKMTFIVEDANEKTVKKVLLIISGKKRKISAKHRS
jgi:putative hemolysin